MGETFKYDTMQQIIDEAENNLLHTYNRYQVVLDHGDGVYLYDVNGKKYLDFMSGIGVFAFGYNNKEFNQALKDQIDKILHTSNYFYNVPAVNAARRMKEISGMDKVFFTNSGAEANEGAIKAANKYAFLRDGHNDHQIIAMNNSFHGRTYGALSVTGNTKYRQSFGQMTGDVQFAQFNDFDSVNSLVNEKTCAIMLEVVQGEGGINTADEEFLTKIRRLCDERDILLIFDEVQCGMGRTGYMFAWQKFGIKPDIMTCAKAMGGGVPVGAFLLNEKAAKNSLKAGDHGTTYGGNPFACAAINKVLDIYEDKHLTENAAEVGIYLAQQLDKLVAKYDCISERRGRGLMQGLVFTKPVASTIAACMDKGLIFINAGPDIIRFLPPLIITREHVDEMIAILDPSIEEMRGK